MRGLLVRCGLGEVVAGGMEEVAERSMEEVECDGDRVMGGIVGDGGALWFASGRASEVCLVDRTSGTKLHA